MSAWELFSQPACRLITAALVHFIWQGALVALTAATALSLLRRRSAEVRYLVGLAALLAMAACPAVTAWALADLSGPETVAAPFAAQSGRQGAAWLRWSASAQPYLFALWLSGVSCLGLRLLVGLAGLRRLRRELLAIPWSLEQSVARLKSRLGVGARVGVFGSHRVREAMVVGFWRPVVLTPAAWLVEMPVAALEAVIAHELAHVRRWDVWANLAQRLIETFLFYHPAVWWLSRRVRREREFCCDALAAAATGEPAAYASVLELVARRRLAHRAPALAAAIHGEGEMALLQRVRHVLGASPTGDGARLWPAGLLALLAVAVWGWLGIAPGDPGATAWAQEETVQTAAQPDADIDVEVEAQRDDDRVRPEERERDRPDIEVRRERDDEERETEIDVNPRGLVEVIAAIRQLRMEVAQLRRELAQIRRERGDEEPALTDGERVRLFRERRAERRRDGEAAEERADGERRERERRDGDRIENRGERSDQRAERRDERRDGERRDGERRDGERIENRAERRDQRQENREERQEEREEERQEQPQADRDEG